VLLIVISDPRAPRFNRPPAGGSHRVRHDRRNLEPSALRAGLAPGQVRRGLGLGRAVVACLDAFAARLGHALWMLQPLAYHNAILFERWGFATRAGTGDRVIDLVARILLIAVDAPPFRAGRVAHVRGAPTIQTACSGAFPASDVQEVGKRREHVPRGLVAPALTPVVSWILPRAHSLRCT
jgi:hypothetical protein